QLNGAAIPQVYKFNTANTFRASDRHNELVVGEPTLCGVRALVPAEPLVNHRIPFAAVPSFLIPHAEAHRLPALVESFPRGNAVLKGEAACLPTREAASSSPARSC